MRRRTLALAGAAVAALALPAAASAHGLATRTDLPVPGWIFAWAAGVVLVLSFVALSTLWLQPRLEHHPSRAVLTFPMFLEPLCGLLGVAAFAGLVYSGLHGTQEPLANILPTFVYVVFWVAIPVASVVLGDIFRPFNPWRAIARAARLGNRPRLTYRAWLGRWPVALGLFAFAWCELVFENRDDPALLAWLAIAYMITQLCGMSLFGRDTWSERADVFGAYFGLAARLAPVTVDDRRELRVRPVLSGLTELEPLPGTVAIVCVLIGTTSFDGASQGLWKQVGPSITRWFSDLGFGPTAANELAGTFGLLVAVAFVTTAYLVGVRAMSNAVRRRVAPVRFAHTLAPIALAYVVAHYFSLLVFQGQAMIPLVSDPLGDGANLLGTAHDTINNSLLSNHMIWYVQVAALILGHIGGLVLAHDRALVLFKGRAAARSQYWMLAIMIGFTSLGLWLLSTVSTSR
ncbi:hypothetical protein [Conexibacter woesei]|uniref:hypothetical protein n=1 Tax=Conexibacter woesei TaxID=191495 RepID=UPI0003F53DAB|nr:hypothetical protein [Conexibacter woesei]